MKSVWWEGTTEYTSKLNTDEKCDVAIIGGGIAGISAAYHCARAGMNVVLLEARHLAAGSSGYCGAFLANSTTLDLADLVEKHGEARAKAIYDSVAQSITDIESTVRTEGIECDFKRCESLYCAEEESHLSILREEYEIKKRLGYSVEFLNSGDPHIPIAGVYGALKNFNEASMNPVAFITGIAHSVNTYGGRIYTDTRVVSIVENSGHVVLQTHTGKTIKTKRVISATGVWNDEISIDGSFRCYFAPLLSYIAITKPIPGLSSRWNNELIWNTYESYQYLRLLPDERILIGGEDEFFGDASQHGASALHSVYSEHLLNKLNQYFPDLDLEVEKAWAGYLSYPLDGMPIIKTHGNITSITTDGLPFGWLIGRMAMERIAKGHAEYDTFFDYRRDFGFWRNVFLKSPMPYSVKQQLLKLVTRYESGA